MKNYLYKSEPVKSGKQNYLLKCIETNTQHQGSQKNQVNRTLPKEISKAEITYPKEIKIEEFRIILLKKFIKLQEQLNEIRKTMHEQNEKLDKEIETIHPNKQTNKQKS